VNSSVLSGRAVSQQGASNQRETGLLLQVQLFINHVKYLQALLFEMSMAGAQMSC